MKPSDLVLFHSARGLLVAVAGLFSALLASAEEPVILTLDNVPDAKPIRAGEPVLAGFSAERAARYLDTASLDWQLSKDCATCHTNMAYMMARPALSSTLKDSGEVREFFESYHRERWDEGKKPPKKGYRSVVVATALVFNDVQTSGKLSDPARKTLDMMWKTQDENGAWTWPKCGWAPMEVDDHYGVTLAALAAGVAPDGYAETEMAGAGLQKVRYYLQKNAAPSLHHRIMIAWASLRVEGLMKEGERQKVLEAVFSRQLPEGGWSTPSFLVDWKDFKRKDGKPHDPETPDAYGTGLAMVLAREMGVPPSDERMQKGTDWLKRNQGESGMWFTRSPSKDSKNYFTNFGTAFAVLGLQAGGELPGWPFREGSKETGPKVEGAGPAGASLR